MISGVWVVSARRALTGWRRQSALVAFDIRLMLCEPMVDDLIVAL